MQTLRGYQEDAIQAVITSWAMGKRPLVELATGLGKTTILAELIRRVVDPQTQRVLIVVPTLRIMKQMFERIDGQHDGVLTKNVYGPHMHGGLAMLGGGRKGHTARIVVATFQSLKRPMVDKIIAQGGMFDFLFIDEAHHAIDANTYGMVFRAVTRVNTGIKVLGLTATPKRTDNKALGSIFDDLPFHYRYADALRDGFLAPVTRIRVKTGIDLSKVATTGGDYNERKLVGVLDAANWTELAVQAYRDHLAQTNRRTLAYFPTVKQSIAFTSAMNGAGFPTAHTDGETPDTEREAQIAGLEGGALRCLSSVGVYIEGADVPCVDALIFGRPTRSKTVFTQIVGRAVRLHPGKVDCLMIDLTVEDTKGLDTATLIGDMRQCVGCGTHYYTSFKACPCCRLVYVPPPPPQKDCPDCGQSVAVQTKECPVCGYNFITLMKFTPLDLFGKGLHTEASSVFEAIQQELDERCKAGKGYHAWGAWHTDESGFMSLQWDFEQPAFVITSPDTSGLAHLLAVHPKDKSRPKWLASHVDVDVLKVYADQRAATVAQPNQSHKAAWRTGFASQNQIEWAKGLGIPNPEKLTKGALTERITHALVMKKVKELYA